MKSKRDGASISNRSLLADAFEDITQNDMERQKQANGTYAMARLVRDGSGYVVAIVTVDEFSSCRWGKTNTILSEG